MKHVFIRGPLLTQSGYGVHSRQVFKWAKSKGYDITVQLLPWGITPWYTSGEELDGLIGEIMMCSKPPTRKPDLSIQIQLPHEWDPNIGTKNIGVTAGIEATSCNLDWVTASNKMDLVVTPSKFARDTMVNCGLDSSKITVIPESFPQCFFEKDLPEFKLNLPTDFNFLILGQITGNPDCDRKRTVETIANFLDAFRGDSTVGLIVKTNMGKNCSVDREITEKTLKNFIRTQKLSKKDPKVYLLHGYLHEREICALYRSKKIKALISGTRGEGFGLPLLEAAACDLPVIATGYSAHTEFLNLGKWIKLDSELQQIPDQKADGKIWVKGSKWANIKSSDFIDKLKKFRKKGTSIPDSWAQDLGKKIRSNYSEESIFCIYDQKLGKFL